MRAFIKSKIKLNKIILITIIIFSIYLLIKFVSISLSDNIGQAGFFNKMLSYICSSIIDNGSSVISYTLKEDDMQSAILDDIFNDRLALGKFINDHKNAYDHDIISVIAQSYPSTYQNSDLRDSEGNMNDEKISSGLTFRDIASQYLGLEYILTNGAVINSAAAGRLIWDGSIAFEQLNIGYLRGEITPAPEDMYTDVTAHTTSTVNLRRVDYTLEQLKDFNFLIKNFYIVDGTTVADSSIFDGERLVNADMTIKQANDKPQILIFHTHSQEAYRDSRPGVEADTVVGMGELLAKVLREDFNYNVIHDKTYYDVMNGYNKSYSSAEAGIKKMLDKYPSIEVIIDIHRNSGKEKIVYINGKETAQVMMFNGLCRDHQGPMLKLENPYLEDNLALSLQLQLKSFDLYPGLFERNYLKAYRYNLHFRPKSMLVELGSVNNTVESARNAIVLFAKVLDAVLKGDSDESDNKLVIEEDIIEGNTEADAIETLN